MDNRLLEDVVQWDVGNWSTPVRFWDRAVDGSRDETCLEVGGRQGGLSLWMASKSKKVVGSDLKDTKNSAAAHRRKYDSVRQLFIWLASQWRYITVGEILEFLRDYSKYELHTTGVSGTFGRTERQRKLLAAIDPRVLNRLAPQSWQYVVYGIARK